MTESKHQHKPFQSADLSAFNFASLYLNHPQTVVKKDKKINIKIRYPSNGHVENPYTSANKNLYKSSYELLEYHRGILESVKSQRDFQTHVTDLVAPAQFNKAGRDVADPLTKITLPTNYIMLSNFSISCVYEIIELMQIWIDSKKIASKK